tara:strand:- start:605 stop:1576 length:972 start_codon:yes stop_codon:yes gene_type:complete
MLPYLELEEKYAKFVGTQYACATNTGTAALHLAIEALEMPNDTQVIVPDFTMYASGLAVHYARLTPVFIDCTEDLLIDLDKVEKHFDMTVNKWRSRILMITHVYGRTVDMDRVDYIAKKYKLRVIEDACEAQGADVGSYDIGCFSFYRNKIIHAEEGGIITSNDKAFIEKAQDMKNMSFGDKHNYYHKRIGFNYRMSDAQATMAINSLEEFNLNMYKRHKICEIYNETIPEKYQMPNNRKAIWVYDMKHPKPDAMVELLNSHGITARHSFKPLSKQPLFDHWVPNHMAKAASESVFYINVDPNENLKDIRDKAFEVKRLLDEV